jgi:hypothetical protein
MHVLLLLLMLRMLCTLTLGIDAADAVHPHPGD